MVLIKATSKEKAKKKFQIPRAAAATGTSIKTVKKIRKGVFEVGLRKRKK